MFEPAVQSKAGGLCKMPASSRDAGLPRARVSPCSHNGRKPQCWNDSCSNIKYLIALREEQCFLVLNDTRWHSPPRDTQDAGFEHVMTLWGKLGEERRLRVLGGIWREPSWWNKGEKWVFPIVEMRFLTQVFFSFGALSILPHGSFVY